MPDLHIRRHHDLGWAQARRLVNEWVEAAWGGLTIACVHEQGAHVYCVRFSGSGMRGLLMVTPHRLELQARLGLVRRIFRRRIERTMAGKLDELLARGPDKEVLPEERVSPYLSEPIRST